MWLLIESISDDIFENRIERAKQHMRHLESIGLDGLARTWITGVTHPGPHLCHTSTHN